MLTYVMLRNVSRRNLENKLNLKLIREKTLGSLLGVAIGDAMGLPLECRSPAIIREMFGYVDTYVTNKHSKWKNRLKQARDGRDGALRKI